MNPGASLPDLPGTRLTERDNTLGIQKRTGFQELTNFRLEVTGYVADTILGQSRKEVVGLIFKVHLSIEVTEDDGDESARYTC